MKFQKMIAVLFVSLCILLSNAVLAISADTYSGFMENYPAFEADKDRPGALIYVKPGASLKGYTKVMIAPIEIWIDPASEYKGINPDDLKEVSDAFRKLIIDALEPAYPVVDKPGPEVLGLRLAITKVYVTKKKRGLLGFTPVGLVLSTGEKLLGSNMSLQEAIIEAELLDLETGERLGALIDQQTKTGEGPSGVNFLKSVKKGATSWEEIEKVLKFYAERFRKRMDAEHGQ